MAVPMAMAAIILIDRCPSIKTSIAESIPKSITTAPSDSNPGLSGLSTLACVNFSMAPQLFEMTKLPKISNGTFPTNIKNTVPLLGSTLLRQDSKKQ